MNTTAQRSWRAAIVATAVAAVLAVAFDVHYSEDIEQGVRSRVRARMDPFAGALRGAVQRRIGVIVGLRSFADGRRTRAALDEEFPLYARGAIAGTPGIRALEFIEGGRIVAIEPFNGNELAIGFDLQRNPRPEVRADYLRSLNAIDPLVTGPVRLVEGGTGLLLRLRLADRPGFPQIATVVLDVATILREAGVPDQRSALKLAVIMGDGSFLGGDSLRADERPESVDLAVESVLWSLHGVPVEGWDAATRAWRLAVRGTLAALVFVVALIAFAIGMREDRLVKQATQAGSTLDLALRAGRMGVFSVDIANKRMTWSSAATLLFGFEADGTEEAARRAFEIMHPEDIERVKRAFIEVGLGHREDLVEEYRLIPADGLPRWVLSVGHLERGENGTPQRIVGVVSDVTERHALEDQLRQSQRLEAVGKLAGGVAHDFNNLLTAITGFAELARVRAGEINTPAAAAIQEDLQQVMASAQRGASLTAQLLAFSRRSPAAPARVDLTQAVSELQPILERLFAGRVEILADLSHDLPDIRAEMGQLTQVVLNLLVHARDAMPEGGTVTVRTYSVPATSGRRPLDAPPGAWVCLEVQDAGAPLDETMREQILEPYGDPTDGATGTGLGLAVVHGAVENAGGHIRVQSGPVTGSVFRVYLPLWRDTA